MAVELLEALFGFSRITGLVHKSRAQDDSILSVNPS